MYTFSHMTHLMSYISNTYEWSYKSNTYEWSYKSPHNELNESLSLIKQIT
jgi:hypothetical protein